MTFQRSVYLNEGAWFDVAFVQVNLLPAGRRVFDVHVLFALMNFHRRPDTFVAAIVHLVIIKYAYDRLC